jgi:hypothetical protein
VLVVAVDAAGAAAVLVVAVDAAAALVEAVLLDLLEPQPASRARAAAAMPRTGSFFTVTS